MEATPEQAAEGLVIVRVLSAVLDRLVSANTSIARADPGQVTKFHAMKAPAIGVEQYLERIHKYASCSNECFILALIYIDRLIQRNNFLLTELNVHRVVITGILLAAKFFDDAYYNNAYYAKVGGVLVSEMNGLEVDFLFRINFSLHVAPDVFQKYRAELLSQASSIGIQIPPPVVEIPAAPPVQTCLQQQRQQVAPVAQAPAVSVQYTNHALVLQQQQSHTQHAMQITPSPPANAGRVEFVVHQPTTSDSFPPVQRSFSEPVAAKATYYQPPTGCAQTESFSAPALPAMAALQYQVAVDPYAPIDHRIYANHQVGGGDFVQQGSEAQHLVVNRMLAGLSGVGM